MTDLGAGGAAFEPMEVWYDDMVKGTYTHTGGAVWETILTLPIAPNASRVWYLYALVRNATTVNQSGVWNLLRAYRRNGAAVPPVPIAGASGAPANIVIGSDQGAWNMEILVVGGGDDFLSYRFLSTAGQTVHIKYSICWQDITLP